MGPIAVDGHEYEFESDGQVWQLSWWSPADPEPAGKGHGSSAVCVTRDHEIVVVSGDGDSWDFPGGRPEKTETWRETLYREITEEACADVNSAELVGYVRSRCVEGNEAGLVLVRSVWHARVTLRDWNPKHEIRYRKTVEKETVLSVVRPRNGSAPIYRRWLEEIESH